jgi:hypothetical protein
VNEWEHKLLKILIELVEYIDDDRDGALYTLLTELRELDS